MIFKHLKHVRLGTLLLLAALLMAFFLVPAMAVSVGDFTDVSDGAWYYNSVCYVVDAGLFNGTGDTTFEPMASMTRGMFITVLGRYAGVNPDNWRTGTITGSLVNVRSGPGTSYDAITSLRRGTTVTLLGHTDGWYQIRSGSRTGYVSGELLTPDYHVFDDVYYGDYYAGYVIWGYEKGIVNGRDLQTFSPNDRITREEICCLLNRYIAYMGLVLEKNGSTADFTDGSSISSWAKEHVSAMQAYGIVMGEPDGSGYMFRPQSTATRAEVATMFQRLSESVPPATPAPTATPVPTETPIPTKVPQPEETLAPDEIVDTPAEILSETISLPTDTIRVGIYMSTKYLDSCVSSVNLDNITGYKFEYGRFDSERNFVREGTIDSDDITVTMDGTNYTVKDASGNVLLTGAGDLAIHAASPQKTLTEIDGELCYYGDFELRQAYNRPGYITLINYVNIEDYVKGVLPYEYSPSWPTETLKAAAITVRSYAYTGQWGTYSTYGFDITNDAQVYSGRLYGSYSESYYAATDSAADATAGLYLTYSSGGTRKVCTTFYSSSNGGATESALHIFGTEHSYLQGKLDPYDAKAASVAYNYTYSYTQPRTGSKLKSLSAALGLGTIAKDGIWVETYSDTGNVRRVHITDVNGNTAVIHRDTAFDRWDFMRSFGFSDCSYRYTVTYNDAADSFTCTRYGWGHNVGLSQWGAYAMAKYYNKDYQDILGFYYDGTSLQYGAY